MLRSTINDKFIVRISKSEKSKCETDTMYQFLIFIEQKVTNGWTSKFVIIHLNWSSAYLLNATNMYCQMQPAMNVKKLSYYGLRPSRVYNWDEGKDDPYPRDSWVRGIVRHKFYIEEI